MIDNEFDQGMATLNSKMAFRNAAPDCVYFGTDPTEKMNVTMAKTLLKNDLKNKKPTMKVVSKEIFPSADGNSAVFVKKVSWAIFKSELRQVCVYEKQKDGWKMKVWTLNMSIPNAKNEESNKSI